MSNGLESARAMVTNFESYGVDGAGYDETETEPPIMMFQVQVTQIVRFLLERGLRFRNLGFCGHGLM
jgi:hypothetical protein